MNRVLVAALTCTVFFVCLRASASAIVEFCPAHVQYERVGSDTSLIRQQSSRDSAGKATPQTSSLFGFELTARGSRTVTTARLAFDTSGGWYTLDIPAVTLTEKQRHYSAPWVQFIRHDYVTPVLYVRFPQSVTIARAWVYQATAQNDGAFGWQAIGLASCDPPPTASANQIRRPRYRDPYTLDPNDTDRLADPPSSNSLVLDAAPSKPLESTNCAQPFHAATVKRQAQPAYPDNLRLSAETMTSVEVAIEPNGTLADAWVWGPSGYQAFDDAALQAARASTYEGARAYCRAVPSDYLFRVTFLPN